MTSETPLYDEACTELGDPFDTNSETSVALWVASEKLQEDLAGFKELVAEEQATKPAEAHQRDKQG